MVDDVAVAEIRDQLPLHGDAVRYADRRRGGGERRRVAVEQHQIETALGDLSGVCGAETDGGPGNERARPYARENRSSVDMRGLRRSPAAVQHPRERGSTRPVEATDAPGAPRRAMARADGSGNPRSATRSGCWRYLTGGAESLIRRRRCRNDA